MSTDPVVINPHLAKAMWQVLVEEVGAEAEWRELVVKKLVDGDLPIPFVAVGEPEEDGAAGPRRVEVIDSIPPKLVLSDSTETHSDYHRYHGGRWANMRLAALYGVIEPHKHWGFHAFPAYSNLKDQKTHCVQCGLSVKTWREGSYHHARKALETCPNRAPASPLGGHAFERDMMTTWQAGVCAHCEMVYSDWVKAGGPPCALLPVTPQTRERPSSLADGS